MVLDLAPEQVPAIRAKVANLPLAWFVSPSIPAPSLGELEKAGFQLALFPFNTVAAVAEAVTSLWTGLRDQGRIAQSPEMLAKLRHSVQELIGMQSYWEIEKRSASAPGGTDESPP
jgi:2-methylisocitrate lyase-like PEP mutase family enzyme